MALKVGSTTIKKVKVIKNGETTDLKKMYVGSTLVWTGEESFNKQISNAYHNNGGYWGPDTNGDGSPDSWVSTEDNWSAFTTDSINIPVGDTFRIDSLVAQCPNSSSTNIVLLVNGKQVLNTEPPGNQTTTYGPYPSASGIYTSTQATNTIQFQIRGKSSQSQWDHSPTGYLTINYTTGV